MNQLCSAPIWGSSCQSMHAEGTPRIKHQLPPWLHATQQPVKLEEPRCRALTERP
jgi:hypothetical protein